MTPFIRFPSRKGFTITELLVVVAIIGILATIVVPVVGKVRKTAGRATCLSNLRQLGTAVLLYAQENRQQLPNRNNPRWDVAALGILSGYVPQYTATPGIIAPGETIPAYMDILRCPADKIERTGVTNPHEVRSYSYNPALTNHGGGFSSLDEFGSNPPRVDTGMVLSDLSAPSRTVMIHERFWADNAYDQGSSVASGAPYDAHDGSLNAVFVDGHAARIPVMETIEFRRSYLSRR